MDLEYAVGQVGDVVVVEGRVVYIHGIIMVVTNIGSQMNMADISVCFLPPSAVITACDFLTSRCFYSFVFVIAKSQKVCSVISHRDEL